MWPIWPFFHLAWFSRYSPSEICNSFWGATWLGEPSSDSDVNLREAAELIYLSQSSTSSYCGTQQCAQNAPKTNGVNSSSSCCVAARRGSSSRLTRERMEGWVVCPCSYNWRRQASSNFSRFPLCLSLTLVCKIHLNASILLPTSNSGGFSDSNGDTSVAAASPSVQHRGFVQLGARQGTNASNLWDSARLEFFGLWRNSWYSNASRLSAPPSLEVLPEIQNWRGIGVPSLSIWSSRQEIEPWDKMLLPASPSASNDQEEGTAADLVGNSNAALEDAHSPSDQADAPSLRLKSSTMEGSLAVLAVFPCLANSKQLPEWSTTSSFSSSSSLEIWQHTLPKVSKQDVPNDAHWPPSTWDNVWSPSCEGPGLSDPVCLS